VNTKELFQYIQDSSFAISMGQLDNLFGIGAQLFHISGLVLVLTSILLVNLRLLGKGLISISIPDLVKMTNPFVWVGLAFLVLSGLFMLIPSAALYEPNPAFWLKMKTFVVALIIQFSLYRQVTKTEFPNRWLAVITAILSLLLWFSVGLSGRAIGFVAA
jgi:hypothetical protein